MPASSPLLDLVRTALALVAGYLAGSLPVSAWVARAAGADLRRDGVRDPEPADTWSLAGPGWGLLAMAGDLAKGVLPVAVAIVTFGWWTGWAAAVGVVAGARWPAFGRRPGGGELAAVAGCCLALAPPAGVIGLATAAGIAAAGRVVGRKARAAAIATGFGAYVVLFLALHPDAARLAGLGILLLPGLARSLPARSRAGSV